MIIGIDLGTTNSLVSIFKDGHSIIIPNNLGDLLTPSVVSIDGDKIIVGKLAQERLITHPEVTVANFKRFMGQDKEYRIGQNKFSPEELSAMVIKKLVEDAKAYLNTEIEEVVVSVPAYFNDDQRWATKTAGELAGVKIERIINEPSAAALAVHYNHLLDSDGRTYMIVDFGGGTLDVSIVDAFDNIIEIVAVAGNNRLGGEDFNEIILQEFLTRNNLYLEELPLLTKQSLLKKVEKCKRQISKQGTGNIEIVINEKNYLLELDYQRFYQLALPLLLKLEKVIYRAIKDAQNKIESIDDIILVGGSCKMPIVQDYLKDVLNKELLIELNPDLAISLGCGIVAGIKERNGEIKDILLSDICPFTLGTEINGGHLYPIIERNTVLPCSRQESFETASLGQTKVNIGVFQGENLIAEENLKLGDLLVPVPKNNTFNEIVLVRFTYDINGILEVDALVESTNHEYHLTIISKKNKMTPLELQQRQYQLQRLKFHPRLEEANRILLARGKRLFSETLGSTRQRVAELIKNFEEALDSQNDKLIKKSYDFVSVELDLIEGNDERTLIS